MDSSIAIIVGISAPTIGIILVCCCVCIVRRRRTNQTALNAGYSQVNHELDEEEIQFKQMIENQSDENIDDNIDCIFGEDVDAELMFDSEEFDTMNMLDKYRDRLVIAGANAAAVEEYNNLAANNESDLIVETDNSGNTTTFDNEEIRV